MFDNKSFVLNPDAQNNNFLNLANHTAHALWAEAEHCRMYRRLPLTFRPGLLKEETPGVDPGKYTWQLRF